MIRKFKYFARLAKDAYLRPQKIVFFGGGRFDSLTGEQYQRYPPNSHTRA